MQILRANNSRTFSIKNAKFSGYYFYMNLSIWRNFQICISVPLRFLLRCTCFVFFNIFSSIIWVQYADWAILCSDDVIDFMQKILNSQTHHYEGQPWMCKQWTVAKQTERFSLTAKRRGYFLLLEDNKSKQRYKVKINNI